MEPPSHCLLPLLGTYCLLSKYALLLGGVLVIVEVLLYVMFMSSIDEEIDDKLESVSD